MPVLNQMVTKCQGFRKNNFWINTRSGGNVYFTSFWRAIVLSISIVSASILTPYFFRVTGSEISVSGIYAVKFTESLNSVSFACSWNTYIGFFMLSI